MNKLDSIIEIIESRQKLLDENQFQSSLNQIVSPWKNLLAIILKNNSQDFGLQAQELKNSAKK